VGVAPIPHVRAVLPVKMEMGRGGDIWRRCHHEMARAKGRELYKISPPFFGRGMGSLVCLVPGRYGDEQIFGALGVA
jgi:hypothetical protein